MKIRSKSNLFTQIDKQCVSVQMKSNFRYGHVVWMALIKKKCGCHLCQTNNLTWSKKKNWLEVSWQASTNWMCDLAWAWLMNSWAKHKSSSIERAPSFWWALQNERNVEDGRKKNICGIMKGCPLGEQYLCLMRSQWVLILLCVDLEKFPRSGRTLKWGTIIKNLGSSKLTPL